MERRDFQFQGEDGAELSGVLWTPEGRPLHGLIQIVHGVAENKERYNRLADAATRAGFAVCAHDLRGHGPAALNAGELGVVRRGARREMVRDIDAARAEALRLLASLTSGTQDTAAAAARGPAERWAATATGEDPTQTRGGSGSRDSAAPAEAERGTPAGAGRPEGEVAAGAGTGAEAGGDSVSGASGGAGRGAAGQQWPFVLLGHSMGSALVRLWTAPRAGDAPSNTRRSGKTPGERGGSADSHAGEAGSNVGRLCGVILSGPPADIGLEVIAGRALAWLVALFRGAARPSPLLDRMAFGAYRRRVSDGRTPCDWLSRDQHEVDNYVSSPYCGFTPSPGLFQELIRSVHEAGRARPAGASADVPVLIAAGSEDPVGRFGEAPRRLQASIRRHHGAAVDLRLYHGARHEVLNETNRDEVVGDLLAWVRRAMPAQ